MLRILNLFDYAIRNTTKYNGRACRMETISFYLVSLAINLLLLLLLIITVGIFGKDNSPLGGFLALIILLADLIFNILIFISGLSLTCRRLHDINLTGWLQLIGFIPVINIALFVMTFFIRGTEGVNRYGLMSGNY